MENIFINKIARILHSNGYTTKKFGQMYQISEEYMIENMFPVEGVDLEFGNLYIIDSNYFMHLGMTRFDALPQEVKAGVLEGAKEYYNAILKNDHSGLDEKLFQTCKERYTYLKNMNEYNLQHLKQIKNSTDSDYSVYKYGATAIVIANNQDLDNPNTEYFFKAWDGFVYQLGNEEFENLIDGLKIEKFLDSKPAVNLLNKKKIGNMYLAFENWKETTQAVIGRTYINKSIKDFYYHEAFLNKTINQISKQPLKEEDMQF